MGCTATSPPFFWAGSSITSSLRPSIARARTSVRPHGHGSGFYGNDVRDLQPDDRLHEVVEEGDEHLRSRLTFVAPGRPWASTFV